MDLASHPLATQGRTLTDWLVWQETLHIKAIDLDLQRCRRVAAALELQQPPYWVVSVAGTNGKGSSVEMLGSVLKAAGLRVGLYTSPHLMRYNERIRIDGEAADDAAICAAFERIEAVRDTSLTYFEFGTLAALDIFRRSNLDVAVLEVGLGGRLDAVNILDAEVALITSIDLDHMEWLGDTRDSIGREKAGICRRGRPLVISDPDAPAGLLAAAREKGAEPWLLGRDFGYADEGAHWSWWCRETEYRKLPRPGLTGAFQLQNAAGVLMCLSLMSDGVAIAREAVERGLAGARLTGRLQSIPGPVEHVLDVAHNCGAAAALAQWVATQPERRNHLVLGMLKDKDIRGVVDTLAPIADAWYLGSLGGVRGATSRQLAQHMPPDLAPCRQFASVAEAADAAHAAAVPGERVVVTGSFITVSEVLSSLQAGEG